MILGATAWGTTPVPKSGYAAFHMLWMAVTNDTCGFSRRTWVMFGFHPTTQKRGMH